MKKFENVELIDALRKIMVHNTRFYQSDFRYDIRNLTDAAEYKSANKSFLWISRDAGTWCLPVRDVYIENTQPHNTWIFENSDKSAKAFWVDVFPMKDGQVSGNIYEIDYPELTEHVKQSSLKPTAVEILFRNPNSFRTFDYEDYNENWGSISHWYGIVSEVKYLVPNEYYLNDVIYRAKEICADATQAATIDEYVQDMIREHFHSLGYTADDMAYVIPDDVYNALKSGVPAYALFPDNIKRQISSNKEAQDLVGNHGLFGIRHEDKQYLNYLVERPNMKGELFSRDELTKLYSIALSAGKSGELNAAELETVGGILSKLEKLDTSLNSPEQEQELSLSSEMELEP